jgi:glyoxylase-like metal-dependent hydrolase (beta-lactamase superfamily II)
MEQLGGKRAIDPPSRLHMLRSLPTWGMQGLPFPHRSDWEGFLKFYFKPGEPWRFSSPVGHVLGHGEELPGLEGWTLLETPGHCDNSICLHHARAGLLISGDTIRNFLGGEWNSIVSDPPAYARTRRMLESLDVDIVLPAHGPVIGGKGIIGRLRSPSLFTP